MPDERDTPRSGIPPNITKEHIIHAIEDIDKLGYPDKNESRVYDLVYLEKHYPPKVVLSRANFYANGSSLDVSEFSGGEQFANKFLKDRGFVVVLKGYPPTDFEYESHSWTIISDTLAEKEMDRSSFKHHGTGIPVDIRRFFDIDSMKVGERREVTLIHGVFQFPAHIEMINEKNPRTRLLWRTDLQSFINDKFPVWSKLFDSDQKPTRQPPILKIVKTKTPEQFRISFEEIKRASASLVLGNVYSREELKQMFQVSDASINNGIFRPKDLASIWLFVTEEKTPDRTQYKDNFDGQVLHFEGQMQKRTDDLIINHEMDGNEILVFYRKRKNEFANFGFKYEGPFEYFSHTPSESGPTRFILYPLESAEEKEKSTPEPVVADTSYSPAQEGQERTRIETTYERNPKNRLNAIKIHGTKCSVCGFDFGKTYGPYGEGFIEIHHITPHYAVKSERVIDPKKDLVPVCSNCHRMIHKSRDSWLTIEDAKRLVRK